VSRLPIYATPGARRSPRSALRRSILHHGSVLAAVCLGQFAASAHAAAAGGAASDQGGLAEVVITAEKVRSTVQEVPISVSAVSSADLETAGITRIEDIAREVPGLSVRYASPGLAEYEARGLASNGAAARRNGMTEAQYSELLAIVGLANETNRLVTALAVPIDPQFL
jgi:outer membrane receptor for ferric coprogen and ferric-rhodotorulic acid